MSRERDAAIAELETVIPELEASLVEIEEEANRDEILTDDERAQIRAVSEQIQDLRAQHAQLVEERRAAQGDGGETSEQPEARTFEILIRTEILSPDPQAGMKSEQTLVVDFGAEAVRSSYVTGTTHVPVIGEIGSIRDSFRVTKVAFAKPDPIAVSFSVTGETATGVGFVPNINYQMDFEVNADGSVSVSGDHDGYPAYFVSRNGTTFYTYRHRPMEVYRLAGTSDVTMSPSTIGPL